MFRTGSSPLHATPAAADRAASVLSVNMALAEIYGYRPEDSIPCADLRRSQRKGRERFLSDTEVRRLGTVLTRHGSSRPLLIAIIRLLLLTGFRSREVRTLHWRDVRDGRLYIPGRKTGPRTVSLSSLSRVVLAGLPKSFRWIFPSPQTEGPISETIVFRF